MGSPAMQIGTLTESSEAPSAFVPEEFESALRARELKLWLRALGSFFNLRNHPVALTEHQDLLAHDWSPELRIVRAVLLRCSCLSAYLLHLNAADETIFDEVDSQAVFADFVSPDAARNVKSELADDSLRALSVALEESYALCRSLLELSAVSLPAWSNLGEILRRRFAPFEAMKLPGQSSPAPTAHLIPVPLLALTRERMRPAALGADLLLVFTKIFELLDALRLVERALREDQPLKQTMPLFTLVYQEARSLVDFVKHRTLLLEGLERDFSETFDSTNYAITMELRKVFAHELTGLSSLRQAPAIYVKIENAHGLLRDSLQQSVIALAQMFDATIVGAHLFDAFQARLEQSLVLRRDLWTLLQLVRHAETEPEHDAVQRLLQKLDSFYEGSLRFLMFKDWEACERFMEEIGAARDAAELAPVLHRFAAYLEALSNQVNMRAVLATHPFDYPQLEIS